jgi:hypothetical protein
MPAKNGTYISKFLKLVIPARNKYVLYSSFCALINGLYFLNNQLNVTCSITVNNASDKLVVNICAVVGYLKYINFRIHHSFIQESVLSCA